jgi:bacteriocin-like protein
MSQKKPAGKVKANARTKAKEKISPPRRTRKELSDDELAAVSGGTMESTTEVIAVSHEIVSPRDPASGLPTGKRMHKPFVG